MNRNRIVLTCLLLLAGCGPLMIFAGGQLEGSTMPVPDDWGIIDDIKTIQLESRPSDPYSVNIWAIGMGPLVYVHAGANRAAWVKHIEADSEVKIRVGESLYELRAERVTEKAEFDAFSDVYETKYGKRPRNENVSEAYLFRLVAR